MQPLRYCLVWDNTQKLVVSRDQCRKSHNKMLLWANAYAARNRVTELTVKQTNLTCTLEAWKIPIVSFLPSTDDFDMLRERMVVMVSRILAHHISFFDHQCSSNVVRHVVHAHTSSSAVKSQLVTVFTTWITLHLSNEYKLI